MRAAATSVLVLVPLACGSDVVRLPDCIDCRPIEMGTDQELEVELGSDRAVSNDPEAFTWILVDDGSMELLEEIRIKRPEDEDEFVGGYSRGQTFILQPTGSGRTNVRFDLVATDRTGDAPAQTLDLTVIVND